MLFDYWEHKPNLIYICSPHINEICRCDMSSFVFCEAHSGSSCRLGKGSRDGKETSKTAVYM